MTQPVPFYKMHNVIQDYAWGSKTSINTLFGIENATQKPQAEIWMGAHPNGCSQVEVDGERVSLAELVAQAPEKMIGGKTQATYGELPYLFKVLAAEKALSIQVHPSKAQAEAGYAREEAASVALSAANRNYKDPNHKPELVYALTSYQAMNGFRELDEMVALFEQVAVSAIADLVAALKAGGDGQALQAFFHAMLSLSGERKDAAVAALMAYAKVQQAQPLFALLVDLEQQYPGDIGLFAPLMLNVLTLQPGEAMFLDACTPHAYIKGTALEIMANSDNVLRAGLTPKYMDVEELVACTRFESMPADSLLTQPVVEAGIEHFPVPVDDFKISFYQGEHQLEVSSAEIVLAVDAPLTLTCGETVLCLQKGESAFVPAATGRYSATSTGRYARAYN
ncbi:mannose-6-phosphate isomerase, class I [Thaumasiovibrio sp. DFM-14]|uniref:mannose-6-phosphate isomerase, class I n=1 Tax=Thaumasiovibrio sp. DFM-14 TaxID=3384792 RepID=UPI00399F0D8E